MKRLLLISTSVALMFLTGCSGKKYFEPENTLSPSGAISSHQGKSLYMTRDGATFDTQTYISKSGAGIMKLKVGEIYLSENSSSILTTDQMGKLSVTSKSSKQVTKTVSFEIPIVSAGIKGGLLVYLLQDNTFGIYKLSTDEKIIENKAEDSFAVDSRIATPMFIDNLAVIPTLDGKLLVLDMRQPENARVIYISSEGKLNNVIYLSRVGNLLVAATPNRVMTIGTAEGEYTANISEVSISGGFIYVFTKAGEVVKLNSSLKEIARKKFKFAHFSAATVVGGRVYALDQQGSLVVMDSDFKRHRIYDVGEVDSFAFVSGRKIYKDDKVISLDKLAL